MRYISSKKMAKVDKLATEKYGISILQMLENVGKNSARFIRDRFHPKKVVVVYGKGNNGGGSLAVARHLKIIGSKVVLVEAEPDNNKNVQKQLKILRHMGVKRVKKIPKADVIVDGLLGYNIKGKPKPRFANLIKEINRQECIIVSIDIPSGIHPDKGKIYRPYVKADYTLTLAWPKKGVKGLDNVYLTNIGIPQKIFKDINFKVKNHFEKEDTVRLSFDM
jgi:NAD(P)H-hydrate epimerase